MGFFHQLRLLLWKNLTLKKRSPVSVYSFVHFHARSVEFFSRDGRDRIGLEQTTRQVKQNRFSQQDERLKEGFVSVRSGS